MKPLVECVHPKLGPDRIVLMPGGPRNGWRERTVPSKSTKPKGSKSEGTTQTSRQVAGTDSPSAGESTTTKEE